MSGPKKSSRRYQGREDENIHRIAQLISAAIVSAFYAAVFFAVWCVAQIPGLRAILIVGVIVGMVAGGFALIAVMGASVFQDRNND